MLSTEYFVESLGLLNICSVPYASRTRKMLFFFSMTSFENVFMVMMSAKSRSMSRSGQSGWGDQKNLSCLRLQHIKEYQLQHRNKSDATTQTNDVLCEPSCNIIELFRQRNVVSQDEKSSNKVAPLIQVTERSTRFDRHVTCERSCFQNSRYYPDL